jgi:hypothetical protein
MRLREQTEAGYATGTRKLMPLYHTDGAQVHRQDNLPKQFVEKRGTAQGFRGAAVRVNKPLDSAHGVWDYG